jgi:hypothetical protein
MNIARVRGLVLALSLGISACGGGSDSEPPSSLSAANRAPTISLNGDVSVQITVGSSYSDPGASATDAEDGPLSGSIRVDSTLDSDRVGSYRIFYTVTDSAGVTVSVTRTVEVVADAEPPNPAPPMVPDPGDPVVRVLIHPGAPLTLSDLETLKAYVDQGKEPWKSGYDLLAKNGTAQHTYIMAGPF